MPCLIRALDIATSTKLISYISNRFKCVFERKSHLTDVVPFGGCHCTSNSSTFTNEEQLHKHGQKNHYFLEGAWTIFRKMIGQTFPLRTKVRSVLAKQNGHVLTIKRTEANFGL